MYYKINYRYYQHRYRLGAGGDGEGDRVVWRGILMMLALLPFMGKVIAYLP